MSKKSRKRNKKILAALALAGGAAMMAKRKPTAALGTTAPDFVKGITPYKAKADMMKFPNAGLAVGVDHHAGPFERSQVAPYLKGIKRSPVDRRSPSRWNTGAFDTSDMSGLGVSAKKGGRIGAKKGGRVTGAAKRGFGRALMKGKK